MTKKHFIALADAVRGQGFTKEQLAVLARFCLTQNPNFNRQRWLDYIEDKCGPSGGKV
jgi:hypothetical protein